MNAFEHCKAKLEELNDASERIAAHCARMTETLTDEILAINSEIAGSSKSVASVLKEQRKRLEKARKIFSVQVEEVNA